MTRIMNEHLNHTKCKTQFRAQMWSVQVHLSLITVTETSCICIKGDTTNTQARVNECRCAMQAQRHFICDEVTSTNFHPKSIAFKLCV